MIFNVNTSNCAKRDEFNANIADYRAFNTTESGLCIQCVNAKYEINASRPRVMFANLYNGREYFTPHKCFEREQPNGVIL